MLPIGIGAFSLGLASYAFTNVSLITESLTLITTLSAFPALPHNYNNQSFLKKHVIKLKEKTVELLKKFNEKKAAIYAKVLDYTLKNPNSLLNKTVKAYLWLIMSFHYYCEITYNKIGGNVAVYALIVSYAANRLHVGFMLLLVLLFMLRLDFAFNALSRYYRARPGKFQQHFPMPDGPKRQMWSRIAHAVSDAASNNKLTSSLAAATGGMLVWKALDVREQSLNNSDNEKTRAHDSKENEKNRQSDDARHDKDLALQKELHKETLANDSKEREKDRQAESTRHKETLAHETQENEKSRNQDERHHQENMQQQERHHQETLKENNTKPDQITLQEINDNKPQLLTLEVD